MQDLTDRKSSKVRPVLSNEAKPNMNAVEDFQNTVLRPILKMQHELILSLASEKKHLIQLKAQAKNLEDYVQAVLAFVKKQTDLKNQLIGVVIGQFTADEFQVYATHISELNKRITTMAGERIAKAMY